MGATEGARELAVRLGVRAARVVAWVALVGRTEREPTEAGAAAKVAKVARAGVW